MAHSDGLEPNLVTCSAVVAACAKGLKWGYAVATLKEMLERRGIRPNAIAFNAAISACGGRSGGWVQALQLFGEMPRLGLARTEISYNSAISACEYRQHWERSLLILRELLSVPRAARCGADVVSFNSALSCCKKVRVQPIQQAIHKQSRWNKKLLFVVFFPSIFLVVSILFTVDWLNPEGGTVGVGLATARRSAAAERQRQGPSGKWRDSNEGGTVGVWPNRVIQITDHSKQQQQNNNNTTSKSQQTVIWNTLRPQRTK
ncbi:unnamed protein product [Polarella glacialis]|uniref:Pentatricopeptide repeat-containing protein n=1 Tax=Polarella glacialis TaxID=89957 RepID=A0A813JQZ2_POLGL|nr:unnamed protein product [Polarella glacialis]